MRWFFFICILITFLVATEPGTKLTFNLLSQLHPAKIRATEIHGRLIDHISLKDFSLSSEQKNIRADIIEIKWNPGGLFTGLLDIQFLKVKNFYYSEKNDPASNRLTDYFKKKFSGSHNFRLKITSAEINQSTIILPQISHPLYIKKIFFDSSRIGNLSFNYNKTNGNLFLSLGKDGIRLKGVIKDNQNSIDFSLAGFLGLTEFRGKLEKLNFFNLQFGRWKLQKITPLIIKQDTILFPKSCLVAEKNQSRLVCFSLHKHNQAWDGQLGLKKIPIQIFSGFFPKTKDVSGEIESNFYFNKSPKTYWRIQTHTNIKQLFIKPLNIVVSNFSLEAEHQLKNKIVFSGTARAGGHLNIKGSASWGTQWSIVGTATGSHFRLFQSPEYQIEISPQLTIRASPNKLILLGDLLIPNAQLKPKQISSHSSLSRDIVFIDEPRRLHTPFVPIDGNIHLIFGENVRFQIPDLTGRATGDLYLKTNFQDISAATGNIHILDGAYHMYHQTLKIKEGLLNYLHDPIENPNIKIKIERLITTDPFQDNTLIASDNTIVGLTVLGRLKDPKYHLYAIPAHLKEADILSYLLFGKPMSQTKEIDGDILLGVISSLNQGKGNFSTVLSDIQNTIGLDQIKISSSSNTTALNDTTILQNAFSNSGHDNNPFNNANSNLSLLLGKAITPRLYVSYSQSISDTSSILRIRYLLSKRWSVQTENSTLSNGIDLLYTREHP